MGQQASETDSMAAAMNPGKSRFRTFAKHAAGDGMFIVVIPKMIIQALR
jgi:hypothetical protein